MSTKVVIAGGGTGGHVYPALSIAQGLVEEGLLSKEILFIGSKHSIEKTVVPQEGFKLVTLPGKGLNRGEFLKNVGHIILFKIACIMLFFRFVKERPEVVIGVGGYASAPALFIAFLLGIKRVVHEQNSYLGRTNYMAQKMGAQVLTTFEHTQRVSKKAMHVGLPMRSSFETAMRDREEFCSKSHDRFRLTVSGGSLGAKVINQVTVSLVEQLQSVDCDIVHVCGSQHYDATRQAYAELGDPANVILHSYREDISIIYSRSDLVVSRSGAGTCVELETLDIDCILIPLPNAANDHQRHNARALVEKGKAELVNQQDLTVDRLAELVKDKMAKFHGGERSFEPYGYHLEARNRIAKYISRTYLS